MFTTRRFVALIVTTLAAAVGLGAQTGGNIARPSDNEVKTFVKQVRENADKFVDALDGSTKDQTIRSAQGETKVSKYLDDFKNELKQVEERFKPDYSASTEVRDALRRSTEINTYLRTLPRGTRGESEWNRLSDDLNRLAGMYGTTFPVAPDAPVRRLNDKEVAGVVDGLAKKSDALRKSVDTALKQDKTVDAAARQQMVGTIDQLTRDTKALKSRIEDGQAASAEAERMLNQAQKVKDLTVARSFGAPVTAAWTSLSSEMATVARVFGRSW